MKIIDVFRSRIILFIIQILLLSLFIYSIGYYIDLNLDMGISIEREKIIQILASYTLFNDLSGLFFLYISWILVSLIPIFIYNNFKKAYSMNLMTFFFPNFFLYVFLRRHSKEYFNSYFQFHFLHTFLLGIVIVGLSIVFSLILKKVLKFKSEIQLEDLSLIASKNRIKCPNCGAEFNSTPKFCYNCNADLTVIIKEKNGKEE